MGEDAAKPGRDEIAAAIAVRVTSLVSWPEALAAADAVAALYDRAPQHYIGHNVMRPMTAAEEAVEAEIDSWDAAP